MRSWIYATAFFIFPVLSFGQEKSNSSEIKRLCANIGQQYKSLSDEMRKAEFLYKNGQLVEATCDFDSKEVYKSSIRSKSLERLHHSLLDGCGKISDRAKCLQGLNSSWNSAKRLASPFIIDEGKKDAFVQSSESATPPKLVPAWTCRAAGKIRTVTDAIICDGDSEPKLKYIEPPSSLTPMSVDRLPPEQRKELGAE